MTIAEQFESAILHAESHTEDYRTLKSEQSDRKTREMETVSVDSLETVQSSYAASSFLPLSRLLNSVSLGSAV